jgi:Holliday junction resolvase
MGKSQRTKGAAGERELVNILKAAGYEAKRVPLSGASWIKDDVITDLIKPDCRIEVKRRQNGFKQIYGWLGDGADILAIRADRKEWLIVVPLRELIENK